MGWLERFRGEPRKEEAPEEDDDGEGTSALERRSPGLALLFEGLTPDGRHAILDLGLASASRLSLLGPYCSQIRFAGLVPPTSATSEVPLVESIPAHPERPFDVVLAWDILDYLGEAGGEALVRRLDAVTTDDAILYTVVTSSSGGSSPSVRMELVGLDRVRHDPAGPNRPTSGALLPARVEKVLAPFRVVRAISLRMGLREYVARKTARRGG